MNCPARGRQKVDESGNSKAKVRSLTGVTWACRYVVSPRVQGSSGGLCRQWVVGGGGG
jgi:hypothetical protein